MIVAPLIVLAGALYYYVYGGRYVSTDDAYTQAASVSVSANVSGRVIAIEVHDNEAVARGATLFRLDDAPFRIAVDEAEARLASARLQIAALKSTYGQRQSELRAAQQTLAYEQQEYDRHKRLLASGIVSRAQYDQASHALDSARQGVTGVQQQMGAVMADLAGNPNIPLAQHPTVRQAQSALDRAKLNLSYTVIVAPSEGIVTKVEQLQVGDYINASTPLFALVSNRDVWVEANFKEVQLAHMAVGQEATVKIDRFPGKSFAGVVVSMSPSTGSQFSMLPAENATGNWVKVVQRIPVRVHLTGQNAAAVLQAGLSADVTVDTAAAESARHPDRGPLTGNARP